MKKEFLGTTIGMNVYHHSFKQAKLLRCEFYKAGDQVELKAVSGYSLERVKGVKNVFITLQNYKDRDHDYYDDIKEFEWAMNLLECSFSRDECYC